MDRCKVCLVTMLVVALLSATLVCGRPRQVSDETQDLVRVASDLTHALETVVDTLQSETRRPRRRRRMVQLYVARQHHHPGNYNQQSRLRRFNHQKATRTQDISDH